MVVVFFIWAIGVASVNAYKIYECIWNEEKARLKPGHPKKMTQAAFRLFTIWFGKKAATVAVSSGSSVSAFSHASTEQAGEYDLTSYQGVKDYLEENASRMITKERLESGLVKGKYSRGANTVITFSTTKWQRISTSTTRRS